MCGNEKTPSDKVGAKERVKGVGSDQDRTDSNENGSASRAGAAKASVTLSTPMPADEDLRAICEAWPALPGAIKAGVLALINAGRSR
jgi:hypothetical protein